MPVRSMRRALPWLLLLVLPTGCQRHEAAAVAEQSPEAAMRHSVELLKTGRIGEFWQATLPPADYAAWRARWNQPSEEPPGALDPAGWDDAWRQLAAPGAQETLYTELEPKLAAVERKYADQWPLLVNIGQATLAAGIERNPALNTAQKQQLDRMLEVLQPWVVRTDWFDRDRARRTIAAAVSAARRLDVRDPDGLRDLDFDGAMRVYATAFEGAKQVLAIYGLSVQQTLDSVHVIPLDYRPPYARVRIEYTVLGKPLAFETTMTQIDGHWYDEDLGQSVRQAPADAQPPAQGALTAR